MYVCIVWKTRQYGENQDLTLQMLGNCYLVTKVDPECLSCTERKEEIKAVIHVTVMGTCCSSSVKFPI